MTPERAERCNVPSREPEERSDDMSVTLVSVGYDNFAVSERIIAIVSCTSAPVRRLVQECRQSGKLLDATQGRRMRSVVVMDDGHIITSALTPGTLRLRAQTGTLEGEVEESTDESNAHR
jgi:extracellular matrix regulatory protein A